MLMWADGRKSLVGYPMDWLDTERLQPERGIALSETRSLTAFVASGVSDAASFAAKL